MTFDQAEFDLRLEWGIKGVELLAPISDVIIIVDVLSFSTCVDIATSNYAKIYPYRWKDETASAYADSLHAELANFKRSSSNGFSLSPTSLRDIKKDTKLVLPSPNGATLSLTTGNITTLCGCLRNAKAVAEYAMKIGNRISIIPAGEQWEDKSLRPAFEDLLGAGAILSFLHGTMSPECKSALSVFLSLKNNLRQELQKCSSGKELIERGFIDDTLLACDFNISDTVPVLIDNAFVRQLKSSLIGSFEGSS
ncbi:MAG: 2-phosphosulfolactate phosphatase [Saprospiraceae bacterium]